MTAPTVLVVEDDPELADLYSTWLGEEYDVRVAHTAADALHELDAAVSVALVDRKLPDRDGDDLLVDIQNERPNVRVAVVTGIEPGFDIIDMGFDTYLVKPVTRDAILDTVSRLLARAVYSEEIREFFSLASKRAALETEMSQDELAENDAYRELVERMRTRQQELSDLLSRLNTNDFIAVFRDLSDELE